MAQPGFVPRNPEFAERSRTGFDEQAFLSHLGASLAKISPGFVEIHLPRRPDLLQQNGFFHGGAIGTIADVTGGFAAYSLLAASESLLTVEYKLNIMAPADGDRIIGRGQVLRAGRRLTIAKADIFNVSDGREKLCATMLGTFMTVP